MAGPLAGVRVLDATTVVLGPLATQMLGDLGADVIKIEPPDGDTTRKLGPGRNPDMAAFYLGCNRNKRSVVLDLKQPAGLAALLRLARTADAFVHNFRPQAAARLGVPYEALRAENPGIVYCATYGFRAAGPYGNKPVYDDIIQAASGLAALQAPLVGDPRYLPTIVADKTSSMGVAVALLAALHHRARTGEGQAIEVPMFETLVAWVMVEHMYGATFVPPLDSPGYKRVLNRWRRPFPTVDGYLAVLPYTDAHWRAFFTVAGREDLLADERFRSLSSRLDHIELLYEELGKIVATRTSAEWLATLDRPACRPWWSTRWRRCSATPSSKPPASGTPPSTRPRAPSGCPGSPRPTAARPARSGGCRHGSASTVSRCSARPASRTPRSTPCSPPAPPPLPTALRLPARPRREGPVVRARGTGRSGSSRRRRGSSGRRRSGAAGPGW